MRNQALIWNTDTSLRVTSLTARLRGLARIGDQMELHVSDLWDDPTPLEAHRWALAGETVAFEAQVRGVHFAFEMEPLLDAEGTIAGVTGRALELADAAAERRFTYNELTQLALQDPLTRLLNRAALEQRLAATLSRCERRGTKCAAFFIDLDDFKGINDEHGHAFGDRVLVAVGERLARHVRASDSVARLGGDEFVVLVDDLPADEAALDSARKILHSLEEPLRVGESTVRVRASIGVATHPGGGFRSAAALLAAADHEMYAVKRNGGNGIKLASAWQAHSSPVPARFATLESA